MSVARSVTSAVARDLKFTSGPTPPAAETILKTSGVGLGNTTTGNAIDYPSGIVAGELLVAFVFAGYYAATGCMNLPGFTKAIEAGNASGSTTTVCAIFYKVATGAESGSVTPTFGCSSASVCQTFAWMARIGGVDTASPIAGTAGGYIGNQAAATPYTPAELTTTEDNCTVYTMVLSRHGSAHPISMPTADGFTLHGSSFSWNTTSASCSGALAYKEVPTAGPAGQPQFQHSTGTYHVGSASVAIKGL